MQRLLELVAQTGRLAAAAVYSAGEGGFVQEVAFGSDDFPLMLEPGGESGFSSQVIPSGLLLYQPAGPESRPPDGPAVAALAASLRALHLERRLKQQRFEVNYRGVELEALYDVGLAIASTLNLEQLGEEILLRAVSLLDARRGALYLVSGASYRLEHTFGGEASPKIGRVECGHRPETIGKTALFVLPNPSGRNAHYTYIHMLHCWKKLKTHINES